MAISDEESLVASVPEAGLEALRLRLDAVSLRGLAGAANALLGECPEAVCQVLASWDASWDASREASQDAAWSLTQPGELPSLVEHCWAALAPLGVGLPAGPAPKALAGLLAGMRTEPQVALDALGECRDCADRVPVYPTRSPASDALDGELWRQALVSALDDFWSLMTSIFARARPVLLRGDRAETARLLESERIRLAEVTERIEALANCVASPGWAPPPPDPSAPSIWSAQPGQAPAPPARPLWIDLRSQASADEVRRWLPVMYLAAVTGLAVVVLIIVAYGSPG